MSESGTAMLNLITSPWLPVVRRSGRVDVVAPSALADDPADPAVAVAFGRADFSAAVTEALIGWMQTALCPEEDGDWRRRLLSPPDPAALAEALAPLVPAFDLFGDGARAFQDRDLAGAETIPVAALLIDEPGENGLKRNADLFVKRARVSTLCPACAAAALITLQTYAPSGGKGHRTSLRGGGPLTTLVIGSGDPAENPWHGSLWQTAWLNVLPASAFDLDAPPAPADFADARLFPWLGPTRVSDEKAGGRPTTPLDAHPLQAFWGLPRRLRLVEEEGAGPCDLCGAASARLVRRVRVRPYGVNYTGAWRHPLSPYVTHAKKNETLPVHPQPGGFAYRHWLGLVQRDDTDGKGTIVREPARAVHRFGQLRARALRRAAPSLRTRLWAFGYDMDNMKARAWYESRMPIHHLGLEEAARATFDANVRQLVQAGERAAALTRDQVRAAWFGKDRAREAPGDFAFLSDAFLAATEPDFHAALDRLAVDVEAEDAPARAVALREAWHALLRRAAVALFDEHAFSGPPDAGRLERACEARADLGRFLNGPAMRRAILSLPDRTPTP